MRLQSIAVGAISLLLVACNQAHTNAVNANPKPDVRAIVTEKARKHGVPVALAHGVVKVESGYDCKAVNRSSNATGAMQVLPRTARGVGIHGNLKDCRTGVEAGMRYLALALDRADGDWCGAATLYNRGIYARAVRSAYCRKVLTYAKGES